MKVFLRLSAIVLLVAATCLQIVGNTQAQSAAPTNSGLQISPTRTDLSMKPGEVRTFKITLKNVTNGKIVAKAFLNDFESDNDSGQPRLIIDPSKRTERTLVNYLSGLQDVTLEVGQSKEVELTMSLPANTAPGGYYGAVRYAAIPANQAPTLTERQISLTASVASLILLEVSGPVTQGLRIDSINLISKPTKDSKAKTGTFFTTAPNKLALHLTNTGNNFAQPIGTVSIKKGKKVVYKYEVNNPELQLKSNILPKSSRTFTDDIKNVSSIGRYQVVANLSYKQGGEVITQTKTFWVIPKAFLIGFLILIAALVAALAYIYFKRRATVTSHRKKR